MAETLARIANLCDGVRCDMAMLLLPDVIQRTWGDARAPLTAQHRSTFPSGPTRLPGSRRSTRNSCSWPRFTGTWNRPCCSKGLIMPTTSDSMISSAPGRRGGSAHSRADPKDQGHLVRFLENHDEERVAAEFSPQVHQAAAVLTFLAPGLRLIHEGQLEGRKVRPSVHLGRRPDEAVDEALLAFYQRLLSVLRRPEAHQGRWRLLDCRPAWETNPTWDRFVAFCREGSTGRRLLVAVNYGPTGGQCTIGLPLDGLHGQTHVFQDLMGPTATNAAATTWPRRGLYLDMPEWGYHVFEWTEGRSAGV